MEEILAKKVVCHESYASFASINNLDRAKKRFSGSINNGECSVIKRKQGRPAIKPTNSDIDGEKPVTRSKSDHYDQIIYII